jgi:hypothetical protein
MHHRLQTWFFRGLFAGGDKGVETGGCGNRDVRVGVVISVEVLQLHGGLEVIRGFLSRGLATCMRLNGKRCWCVAS